MNYLKKNPKATMVEITKACQCSQPTVSQVKRSMGLTRIPKRLKAGGSNGGLSEAQMAQLHATIKLVGSSDKLISVIEAIESVGGIHAVRGALHTYHRLQEVFGGK
ncbi:MAG: hypothetical protein KF752_15640 [Pirellulaceae bacterium]|nr:hypothetical protein [Pirellulaceae bacterium]